MYPLLSPAAADSLRTLLRQDKPDTNRVSQLIRLGEYQVYKPGEFTADMDSARTYSVVIQSVNNNYSLTLCELA
ncbi:MAG: hypothetical protein ICV84_20640 [Flavisolibacter sp.]|nr:hypothetical protein [Flavisolibacter sp.]